MSQVKPSQSITILFTISDPSDGAAVDADSTPTGVLYENGTSSGQTVTVTNVSTGLYTAGFSIPSDAAAGDVYDLVITAAVSSVTGKGSVWKAVADTKRTSDLNDVSEAEVNSQVDTALADYDAPTKAELDSGLAGLNDPTAAQIRAEIDSNSTQLAAILVDTGTDIPGLIGALNDLSAAQVNAEVDTALTDYDPPTKAELDSGLDSLNDITVADIMTDVLEGTITIEEALRIMLSALAGESAGGATSTITFRDVADTKNRITATVDDDGNRTAITVDGS